MILIISLLSISIIGACNNLSSLRKEFDQNIQLAEVVFDVQISKPLSGDGALYLEILDEVSGLSYNPARFEMQAKDDLHYFIRTPITIGSVVKYRFVIGGNPPSVEFSSVGEHVRYRMLYVSGPQIVNDIVTGWQDQPYNGETGEISGYIVDKTNNSPIPDIMVIINGVRAFTAADGSFRIAGIPVGQHTLVAYHIDGHYQPFQQEAVIAANASTPAIFSIEPSKYVNVTFNVTAPNETIGGAPIRLIGNSYTFGNTFADLRGGMNALASRAPIMASQSDGSYSLTIQLPVGFDLRYKYTLGDGFWNAEHFDDGSMRIRQIIIPDHDITVNNAIATWRSSDHPPVRFNIQVPFNTPSHDIVSIQFNPYVWAEPIPMWSLGENKWTFTLYSPLEVLNESAFRICRNDQCGIADGLTNQGEMSSEISLDSNIEEINYEIEEWAFWQNIVSNSDFSQDNIIARDTAFTAGIEFSDVYHPSFQPYLGWSFIDIGVDNVNWVFIRPSWSINALNEMEIYMRPGTDPFWNDTIQSINYAKQVGSNIAVFPSINYPTSYDDYWSNASLGYLWWHQWFDAYSQFILHFTDLAALTDSQAIVLGENELRPLLQQESYDIPSDIEKEWEELLDSIRLHFTGDIILAIPYSSYLPALPDWVEKIDKVYIQFSPPLSSTQSPTIEDLTSRIEQIFDNEIYPFYSSNLKPIILGISYPSIDGSAMGCVSFEPNYEEFSKEQVSPIDLEEQADLYTSIFRVINQRSWISGIVSRGYYPPLALHDYSSSIHGKNAENILSFWFSRMILTN